MATFLERLRKGEVLVADGATGTNLQQRGLGRGVAPEIWVLEQPEQIVRLQRDFIAAGADIILSCTFGASSIRLDTGGAGLGPRAAEINRRAVALAREAAQGTGVLVAASLGPTGQLLKPFGPLEEAEA
jgi:5-methyltetrahydrofolate--homocysteine methyltransferase